MIRVQTEDFDIGAEIARLRGARTDIGAIVSFTGTVREMSDGARLETFTLEHYPGMTEAELERIAKEACARWSLLDCLIVHRHGPLKPGDNIVLVVTLSSHRHDAFEAASFFMDFLKTSAPFWKKETAASGSQAWVEARESDDQARARWDKND